MTADPEIAAAGVKRIAAGLGFDDCRVAAVRGPAPHAAEFAEFLADGRHGEMDWLARTPNRRTDPREVLPGARSVVTVALNYWQPDPPADLPGPPGVRGKFARYARGDDYHRLFDGKLRDLCAWLEDCGGVQKLYSDTGPVLERDWATAAGLGWNGKSAMQIHPRMGCYFLLGEILTTLELSPDAPMSDHCGKCVRCIDACPTRAITAPHRVDARRCISYLTIELRGSIPEEFRRPIGGRVFGCDDCLDACPWNRFASASREIAFATREYVAHWPLRRFLSLTDDGFRELFRLSPVRRIKRPAFLRNVCVALGNTGDADDLPALREAAAGPDPLVAEHAAWAIREIERRLGEGLPGAAD